MADLPHRRDQSAADRLAAADERDACASARDAAAAVRDERAAGRSFSRWGPGLAQDELRTMGISERVIRDAGQSKRAARIRAQAAEQRAMADEDRRIAAEDREQSAFERMHALVDRQLLAGALATTEIDPLTGARTRAAGTSDLEHELLRCHRTGRSLVVAYVDVVGLKALNDTEGHRAGDELLVRVVALLEAKLRAYDLIIRLGGDEFLCAMTDVTMAEVRRRFVDVAAALDAAPGDAAIRAGFAELAPGETTIELIARADGQLVGQPHDDHEPRSDPHPPAATAG